MLLKTVKEHNSRIRFSTLVRNYLLTGFVLLTAIFSLVYYADARSTTHRSAVREIEHSVERTQSDLENLIALTQKAMSDLITDDQLYDALIDYDPAADSYATVNRVIQPILFNHLRNISDLCAIQLLNDQYVFYTTNITYTSQKNVVNSEIYRCARDMKTPFWTSRYDFTVEYGHEKLENLSLRISNRNLVSYVCELNAFKVSSGLLYMWPSGKEKPVAVISIREENLRDILIRTLGQYNKTCFLIDADGKYISHSNSDKLLETLGDDILQKLLQSGGEGCLHVEFEGENSLLHFARLSNGWILGTVTFESAIYSGIFDTIIGTFLGVLLCALMLSVLMSLIVSQRLSRPINNLLQAIRITGKGNFDVQIPDMGNEFDVLHAAFNQMVQRIDALIRENYESALRESENEMRMLRYQIKPHFLYNSLMIIRSTAMRNADAETVSMVQNLSDILRYVLRNDQSLATVRDEINNVISYFEIVRGGYENAFSLEIDVVPEVLNAAICKLTLQPLVENCIQHGFDNPSEGGCIRITGRLFENRVHLVVWDSGKAWPTDFAETPRANSPESIGMSNVRSRLKHVFGEDSVFRTYTPDEGGAAVEIIINYKFEADFTDKRKEMCS